MSGIPVGTGSRVERLLTPEPERALPTDPVEWTRSTLDEHLWSAQRRVMRAVLEHRYTAWQACHGPGKSFTAARFVAWWLEGHPPGEAFVVTSAPSGHQVRAILWREIRRAHRRGNLPGTITDAQVPEWKIDGEMVAFGRKPADLIDAEAARTAFQGIHARYVLIVLDEACGIPEWLWEATDTLVTNEASRVLAIGNPDDPTTRFAKVCAPGSGWHVEQTSVFDTPNFTGEAVPEQMREMLPSPTWVEERKRDWGESSPLYIAKVLGLFPEVADDVVISPRLVRLAHERSLPGLGRGRFGMDVARKGADETCIYRNRDGVIRLATLPVGPYAIDNAGTPDPLAGQPAVWRGADTDVSRRRAQALLEDRRTRHLEMTIDVVGLGAGVVDPLSALGYRIAPYSGGEQANDPTRFTNRNAEAWWAFRDGLRAGLIDLDPEDLTLASQLQSRKWKIDPQGKRIRLETKDEMAKRGLPSPDRADAAIMSWYEGVRTVGDPDSLLPDKGEQSSIAGDLLTIQT